MSTRLNFKSKLALPLCVPSGRSNMKRHPPWHSTRLLIPSKGGSHPWRAHAHGRSTAVDSDLRVPSRQLIGRRQHANVGIPERILLLDIDGSAGATGTETTSCLFPQGWEVARKAKVAVDAVRVLLFGLSSQVSTCRIPGPDPSDLVPLTLQKSTSPHERGGPKATYVWILAVPNTNSSGQLVGRHTSQTGGQALILFQKEGLEL